MRDRLLLRNNFLCVDDKPAYFRWYNQIHIPWFLRYGTCASRVAASCRKHRCTVAPPYLHTCIDPVPPILVLIRRCAYIVML